MALSLSPSRLCTHARLYQAMLFPGSILRIPSSSGWHSAYFFSLNSLNSSRLICAIRRATAVRSR